LEGLHFAFFGWPAAMSLLQPKRVKIVNQLEIQKTEDHDLSTFKLGLIRREIKAVVLEQKIVKRNDRITIGAPLTDKIKFELTIGNFGQGLHEYTASGTFQVLSVSPKNTMSVTIDKDDLEVDD